MVKFCYIYSVTEKIERLAAELTAQRKIMRINNSNFNIRRYSTFIVITLIFSTYCLMEKYLIEYSTYHYADTFIWFFATVRDSAECDFLCNIFRDMKFLLHLLNREYQTLFKNMEDIQKNYNALELKIMNDMEVKNFEKSILSLKKLSYNHWKLTGIIQKFAIVLSFSVTLLLARKFIDTVTDAYNFLLIFDGNGIGSIHTTFFSLIYSLSLITGLIDYWTSCSLEVSRIFQIFNISGKNYCWR